MSSENENEELQIVEAELLQTVPKPAGVFPIFGKKTPKRIKNREVVICEKKLKLNSDSPTVSVMVKDDFLLPKTMQLNKLFHYEGHKMKDGNVTRNILVKCLLCEEFKSYTESTTTNLLRHLQLQHPDKNQEIKCGEASRREKESITTYSVCTTKKLARDDPRQKKFDDCVLNLWACNRSTLDIVSSSQFKELIETCDSTINVKSRQAMTNKLQNEVNFKILPELRKELEGVTSGTLSLDLWTSHRKDGILGVKFHFIDENFEIQQRTVAIREVNEKHDADCLKKYVEQVIHDVGLSEKISFVVTDSGANVVKALRDMQKEIEDAMQEMENVSEDLEEAMQLSEESSDVNDDYGSEDADIEYTDSEESEVEDEDGFIEGTEVSAELLNNLAKLVQPTKLRIPCLAHTLQLVVNGALKKEKLNSNADQSQKLTRVAKSASKKEPGKASVFIAFINKIVQFFQNSAHWLSLLRKEVGKGLIRPSATRWNFINDVLKRLNEDKVFEAVQKLLFTASSVATKNYERKRHPGHLNNEHRVQIQELLALLSPLCNLTDKLQADGATAPIVVPEIVAAFDDLKSMKKLKHFQVLHNHLVRDFKSRLEPIISNSAFVLATVLDPRQKLNVFKLKGGRPANDTELKVLSPTSVETMCHLFLENVAPLPEKPNTISQAEPKNPPLSLFERMLMEVKDTSGQEPYDEGISELKSYLKEAINPGTDPLTYWNQKQTEYPNLSMHAKVFLATPATSGSVERLFSELSGLGRARRSRTQAKRLEQLILYREWRQKLDKRTRAKEKKRAARN